MNDRSGCILFILIAVLMLNIAGIYLYLDSNSRFTVAVAENSRLLESIGDQLRKMHRNANHVNNNIAKNGADNNVITKTTTVQDFANAEFQQPNSTFNATLTRAISGFSGNFNQYIRNESTTSTIWGYCNDSLAERNMMQVDKFEPVLAKSWEISEDGLIFTIKLRDDVTWHPYIDPISGKKIAATPVTATDFTFFWEIIQNNDIPCESIRTYYKLVKSIIAIDKYTLQVIWKEPYSKSKEMVLGLSPVPRHYYRPDSSWDDKEFAAQFRASKRNQFVVGCGAYRLTEWKKGASLTLERYENYYGLRPNIKKIKFRVIPEENVRLVELKKGGIDMMGLTTEQWRKETPEPDFRVITPNIDTAIEDSAEWDDLKQSGKTPTDYKIEKYQYESSALTWRYIGYNMRKPIFADKQVRKALTMLTDRDRIIEEVMHGFGRKLAGPFTNNSPYVDESVSPLAYDPKKAVTILKEAGWDDTDKDGILEKTIDGKLTPFEFSFYIRNTGSGSRKVASIIQADLKKVGIAMNVVPLEWGTFIDKINNHAFDACYIGWTGVLEPDPYQVWHSSQAKKMGSNFVGFNNPQADKLIETGRRTIDTKKRTKIYKEFYRLLHEEQPYTFLFSDVSLVAMQKKFYNARVYKLGMDSELMWIP